MTQMTNNKKIIALAPMDGITNCAYRTIAKELFAKHNSDPDADFWMWTEFMNVEGFMHEPGRLIHHLIKTDFEDQTIAQIYGADHRSLVESAQFIDKHMPDYAGIELNIGCPSPKVMSCGGGAGMMRDRPRTTAIIKEIAETTNLPFSIKTRAGLTVEDKEAQRAFILDVAKYCKHIIIHGRTYKQSHSGAVDRAFIHDIKRELGDSCIIIGNGGIQTYEDMIAYFDESHIQVEDNNILSTSGKLDGIMVGQAAIGRPWIFTNHQPTVAERYEVIVRHAQMMIVLFDYYYKNLGLGRNFVQPTYTWLLEQIRIFDASKYDHEKTMIEYRKYVFNYISWLPNSRDLKVKLAATKDYNTSIGYIEEFFGGLEE